MPVGIASRAVEVTPVNDPPSFVSSSLALNLTTLSGIPLNAAVVATDREAAQTRTYSLVSNSQPASGAFTLNSSTGQFTFLPQTAFAGTTTVVIRVTDNLGGSTGVVGNPDAVVTIVTLGGTTTMQPFVTSDPPFEVEEGSTLVAGVSAYDFSVLTNQTRGPASVTVQLVGDFPAGAALTAGAVSTTATPASSSSRAVALAVGMLRPPLLSATTSSTS